MGVGYANISAAMPRQNDKQSPTLCRRDCPAGTAGYFPEIWSPLPPKTSPRVAEHSSDEVLSTVQDAVPGKTRHEIDASVKKFSRPAFVQCTEELANTKTTIPAKTDIHPVHCLRTVVGCAQLGKRA